MTGTDIGIIVAITGSIAVGVVAFFGGGDLLLGILTFLVVLAAAAIGRARRRSR